MLKSRLEKHYEKVVAEDFLLLYNYKSINSLPRMEHLIFHSSSKSFSLDEGALLESFSTILLGTGCRPIMSKAYKSIAQFSIRKDDLLGVKVTLRKKGLFNLLEKLSLFVIPNHLKSRRFEIQKKKKLRKDDLLQDTETRSFSVSGKDTKAFPEISILLLFFSSFTGFGLTGFFSNHKPVSHSSNWEEGFQSPFSKNPSIKGSSVNTIQEDHSALDTFVVLTPHHRFSENLFGEKNKSNNLFSDKTEKQESNHLNSSTSQVRIKEQWLSAFQFPYTIKIL